MITESDVCVFLPLCPSKDTSRAHRKSSAAEGTHGSFCSSSGRLDFVSHLTYLDLGLRGADAPRFEGGCGWRVARMRHPTEVRISVRPPSLWSEFQSFIDL